MISVIIPAHNAAFTIGDCLKALSQQKDFEDDYEVIVVDDGSTDDTAEIAASFDVKLIVQERGRPAAARNAGVDIASGDIICFTDADCVPAENWLSELVKPLADENISGCKGVYRTSQKQLIPRFVQLEYEDKYDRLRGREFIDFIDTYCAAYRRDVLVANGGFDTNFHYLEDQELSFRLASRGYRMVFQDSAMVFHTHNTSIFAYAKKKFRIGFWKNQVVRRYPDRGVSDSHTPQVMKLQMLLTALFTASLLAGLILDFAYNLSILFGTVFLVSTFSFLSKTARKDLQVAIISPLLLFVRALSLTIGWTWGYQRFNQRIDDSHFPISGMNYVLKRAIDIVGGIIGLIVAICLGPWISLALKLTSPGPVFFVQKRIGAGGRPFDMYKFRTMRPGAEGELASLLDLDNLEQPVFKLQDDPRITPIGRFLRRWSLDELPQFWHVLTGHMSLVGPRPEEVNIVNKYDARQRRRLAVKPGVTGPMQISGRADLNLEQRLALEIEYLENYSVWRDLKILLLTIPAVIQGRGAW